MKFLSGILLIVLPLAMHAQQDSLSIQPQKKKKKFWIYPAAAAGYAGATWLTYQYADGGIQNAFQKNHGKLGDFMASSVTDIGLGKTQAILWAGTTSLAFAIKDQKLKKTSIIWGLSMLVNSEATNFFKVKFQRHRPYMGNGPKAFDWLNGDKTNTSFVSAHTSNAFTTATVFATMYKDVKWVPYTAYGLATLVGLSRIYHNAHWASDVMAGSAVGFASAKLIHFIYGKAEKKLSFLPTTKGVYISYNL